MNKREEIFYTVLKQLREDFPEFRIIFYPREKK